MSNPPSPHESIEPNDGRRPLDFEKPEPSTAQRLGAGHQYSYAPGMAPKPRDPAVDAAIESYLVKYRNRTRPPVAQPVEGPPSKRQIAQAAEMKSKFLLHDAKGKVVKPQQIDRAAIAKEVESFPWEAGITKVPTGFCTTKYGRKAVRDYRGQANDDHQQYRRRQPAASSGHNAAQEVRAVVYSDGSNLSLGGFSPLLNDLERVCAYTECLKPLGKDRRVNARYCKGKDCAQRDRRRLAALRVGDANQPLRRKLSCTAVEPASDVVDIIDISRLVKSEVISENTYRESFRDDPFGRLFVANQITQQQYDAAVAYMHDLDEVGARLRAPHRDETDISVWIPREPDAKAMLATEIKRHSSPLARIRAANQAMGREATALLHAALASNAIADVEMLRYALDKLITSREKPWTKPHGKRSTQSTSPSPALEESEC